MTMAIDDITDFAALDPFFRIIREGRRASSTVSTSSTSWPRTCSSST
ncbi:hypothetical protein [Streptomyces mirabilis]